MANDIDMNRYFDDIEGAIEILEIEAEIHPDSEHREAIHERIAYLKERQDAGDLYVDNDRTASPDAWKTLATYTEAEAISQYKIWDA